MPKFEREVEIDAPVEKVWKILTDANLWPQWFPGIAGISDVTAMREGGTFKWTDDEGRTGTGRIAEMEPMKRLEVRVQMEDDRDAHLFTLRSSGGFLGMNADECKVEYTLDTLMGGGIVGRFVAGGNPKDMMRVKKAVHRLRQLVEGM